MVAYGGGVNSTAMLIWMYHKGIPVDLILFDNLGAEQPMIEKNRFAGRSPTLRPGG